MRVLLDCDGVVANLVSHLLMIMGSDKSPEQFTEWDIFRRLDDRETFWALRLMKDPEFWRTLPIVPGAEEGIAKILDSGHDIYWVTSPWEPCAEWSSVRRQWLAKNFDASPKKLVFTSCKYLVSGDVFIDDKGANVVAWQKHNLQGRGLQFTTPYHDQDLPQFDWSVGDSFWKP